MPSRLSVNIDLGIGAVSELNEFKDQAVFRECTRLRLAILNLAEAVSDIIGAQYNSTTDTLTVSIVRGNDLGVLKLRGATADAIGLTDVSGSPAIGFFSKAGTPIIQPNTTGAAATVVVGTGTAINDASTFDGYTLAQVVKALRGLGILA